MKTLLSSLALLLAGCANISYHVDDHYRDPAGIYRGTREGSKAVVEIFTEKPEWHSGCRSEAMQGNIHKLFSKLISCNK